MYEEPEKKSDNDALNQILEEVKDINKKVSFFHFLVIIGLILTIVSLIMTYISWA